MSHRKVQQILWSILIGGMIGALLMGIAIFSAPDAKSDSIVYLDRLSNLGFYGPNSTWIAIGYLICESQAKGLSQFSIATKVVANTDAGVYMKDAYQIMQVANEELCDNIPKGRGSV